MTSPNIDIHRLSLLRLASSLCAIALAFLISISPLNAHETQPAIADVTINNETIKLKIQLTIEPMVAGLDLTEILDTNDSPLAAEYDALRALSSDELEQRFIALWPEIAPKFNVLAGTTATALTIESLSVSDTPDVELPRESTLILTGSLPADDSDVTIAWASELGPIVVRQVLETEDGYAGYLTNGATSEPIPRTGNAAQHWFTAFIDYVALGYEHIVPKGLDHILFVLGLFFFSLKLRPLLKQVTAFTLAHTVTLALATLQIVQIPASIVEPLIAASIVYVAVENIFMERLTRWRTAIVFLFGLLHGLGFASVLGEIGLNNGRFLSNLIGFNVGVELGQLSVIAAAFILIGSWAGKSKHYRKRVVIPASALIALVGAYWFIERLFF